MTDGLEYTELSQRVDRLEERLSLLEKDSTVAARNVTAGDYDVPVAEHPHQLARAILAKSDLAVVGARLGALAHPVRLGIMLSCLEGSTRATEFAARGDMGSTGQIYHHLRQLVNAGWLSASHRGQYDVRDEALASLTVILAETVK
ncbi:ArsR/SmtB family transcription factor [Streptomyces sporangiiformans]|uniref:Winged helix-turn-helix transcriptional regulator n=1 Tax=Streptomyces sporangiiformans TaxID=2315329 RepID=A0A505D8L7_9ACTN|nr:helix-turn-helix domain-containing protein [Streptomyces sporangiiformans]TPQ20783.1 winged helix-turn-helix transcriptional regulator [Streptomyces sporangiiformans]